MLPDTITVHPNAQRVNWQLPVAGRESGEISMSWLSTAPCLVGMFRRAGNGGSTPRPPAVCASANHGRYTHDPTRNITSVGRKTADQWTTVTDSCTVPEHVRAVTSLTNDRQSARDLNESIASRQAGRILCRSLTHLPVRRDY